MEEHSRDREALLHAPAQAIDFTLRLVAEFGEVQDVADDLLSLGTVDAVTGREELEILEDQHVFVGP